MEPSRSIYDSPRLAAQYAYDRPPVHPHIIRAIGEHLRLNTRVGRALDIGCGAGLSTAALEPLAEASVESAIRRGVSEAEIRDWCHGALSKVFGDVSQQVLFDSYVAYVKKEVPIP